MHKKHVDPVPVAQALEQLLHHVHIQPRREKIPVDQARERVTAEPVQALISMPAYPAAAMDGIAVKADVTAGATPNHPLRLYKGKDFEYINTGDPMPLDKDSVIMIEHVRTVGEGVVEIQHPASTWKHVRQAGEDIVKGELILPAHHQIRPVDLGALIAGGVQEVTVWTKPKVAVIPTGSELISPDGIPERGEIPEFNGRVFAAYLEEWGAIPDYRGIVPDDPASLREAVESAVEECDLVILNAGSSMGSRDFTPKVLNRMGEVLLHGVAARPGKPVVLASVSGKPVVGLPGYPVSAYLSLEWFIHPIIQHWYGVYSRPRERIVTRLTSPVQGKPGAEDFVRMRIGRIGKEYLSSPLTRRAGVTMSMVRADGLLTIPLEEEGYQAGKRVELELVRSRQEIDSTILFSGSDDVVLPRLDSILRGYKPGLSLSCDWTQGKDGIQALLEGRCHIAGVSLPDSGSWSRIGLDSFQPDTHDLYHVPLFKRTVGWMARSPRLLSGKRGSDLCQSGLRLLNRPSGCSLRAYLDGELQEKEIDPYLVKGYHWTESSHLRGASAVAEGTADVALGLKAAASLFGLAFMPLFDEIYCLYMPFSFADSEPGKHLLEAIRSDSFRAEVDRCPGYTREAPNQGG
ncbi:molybdopterin biosynthesis protein [Kroppenstedtia pulmonis]|uniref:Molybdopterin molybdenumtransferase n=1 Tax=Kroppenstedtia pulmonis TaxID=1380685 RepID=A0A7D4BRB9_9BACL|nr:molybdopterin biosynthesis protein [Kroppenstedtia pulmonis]QKG85431.1 molybdopterin biosynthesis protein [Kroppenstedtia pulmonis]